MWIGLEADLVFWPRDEEKAGGLDSRARKMDGRLRLSHVGEVKERTAEVTADRRAIRKTPGEAALGFWNFQEK